MKKLIYLLFSVSFIFTACKKEEGCTDSTATNYSVDAEEDDGSCNYGIVGGAWITNSEEITMHAVVSMGGMIFMDTTITEIETNQDSMGSVIQKFWSNNDFKAWDNNGNLVDSGTWVQSGNTVTVTTDTVIVGEILSVTKTNLIHQVIGNDTFTEDGADYVIDYIFIANHTRDANGFTTNNTNQRKGITSWINKKKLINSIKF
ncbi:MAG: hypothetical protein HN522_04965 [Flavobacteriales bacterium]|jgi:hypothetical protein|nr:hypothetical protein [Flavobacteriales bacterium]MBT5089634.1 hypothetical protein [Flavobacteriales bacterium]MBT5750202.1 hypothetical protein [Flavobacteriales bacterium]